LPEELKVAEICQAMGWDYYTYQQQPFYFIEMVWINIQLKKQK